MSLRLLLPMLVVGLIALPSSLRAQDDADPAAEQPAAEKPAAEQPADEKPADEEPADEEPASAETPAASEAAQAWQQAFEEWKQLLVKLRQLREKYQVAETGELEGIRKEYNELLAQGETMLAGLQEKALAAFKAAPNEDRQLTRFLVQMTANDIKADNYQDALSVAQVLIDNNCEDKQIYNLAGIAAYGTNNFGLAEDYLTKAKDAKALTHDGDDMLASLPDVKAAWKEEQKFRAAEEKADDLPRVKLKTSEGDIVVELYENEAPDTVGNFISLVEKGFYDGRVFHRVIPGFMAQTGCPKGDGTGGPGYKIYCESYKEPHRNHFAGSLSMAHAGRDTGGSQFYITFRPTPHLNGKHTVFGRVIEGQDVLSKLQRIDPSNQGPQPETDKIIEAEVLRKRDHEYKPNKVS